MNKILIVGHPQSGYQEVESLLNDCGMSKALPSRREGFKPEEIGATLCKAHKARPLQQISIDNSIEQLEASPVWHGMALDLMLGNVDQELWGWADPSAVYLLDYWKSLDQNMTFILVYNAPETLLAGGAQNESLSEEELQQRAHIWQTYNAALLHFYYRNRERCLLVHARQVRHSANNYLQQVRARIGAPLAEPEELLALTDETETHPQNALANVSSVGRHTENDQASSAARSFKDAALEQYLAQALISRQPQVVQLYAELQSTANLPLAEESALATDALQAWRGLSAMHALTSQITQHAEKQRGELHRVQEELKEHQEDIQRLTQEAEAKAMQIEQHLTAQSMLLKASQEQQQENEIVLQQLHQIQEELERFYLENRQQGEKLKTLQQLEKLTAHRAKELEQLHQEKAKLASEKESLKKVASERSAQAEELKKTLEKEFKRAEAQAEEIRKRATESAAANEGTKQENELLLLQLHQVQEELERFYLENQRLKQSGTKSAKKPAVVMHCGAAERVKSQLSYRLGAVMMQNYHTLPGLVRMPWALLHETRQFRRSQAHGEKLPSLRQYHDAHKGHKVKQHLTYRLGATLIAHSKSPVGWIKLPFALRREVKNFKQQRKAA